MIEAFTYLDEKVLLSPHGSFHVVSLGNDYDTALKAKEAIERAQKQQTAVAKEKLDLLCMDSAGEKRLITGIHAGSGKKLFKPKAESYGLDFYPDCELASEAIKRKKDLEAQLKRVNSVLLRIELSGDPYTRHGCVDLPQRYGDVKLDYEKKLKAATSHASLDEALKSK